MTKTQENEAPPRYSTDGVAEIIRPLVVAHTNMVRECRIEFGRLLHDLKGAVEACGATMEITPNGEENDSYTVASSVIRSATGAAIDFVFLPQNQADCTHIRVHRRKGDHLAELPLKFAPLSSLWTSTDDGRTPAEVLANALIS